MKKKKICSRCVNVDGLGLKNPATGNLVKIEKRGQLILCEQCEELEKKLTMNRDYFDKEIEEYLNSRKRILFAYSGGLDSTAVLYILKNECQKRNIELITFTINHGFKGSRSLENINSVIRFLGIDHFWVDIGSTFVESSGLSVLETYKQCFEKKILPCGKICNGILDKEYERIMSELDFTELFTGGDTPKKNEEGNYSIFWKKKSGILIVRGGYAFDLNKELNQKLIIDNEIPWVNPLCGGYDTDCLLPGAFFRETLNGRDKINLERLAKMFPIIFDYLSERVRFGTIDYDQAIKMLEKIDIGSKKSYKEIQTIFKNI